MNTLQYLIKRFNIDPTKLSPFYVPFGREKDIPRIFNELGFKVGAEIGVWSGNYTLNLLQRIPGLKLFGIDSWRPYKGYKDYPDNSFVIAYKEAHKKVIGYDCKLIDTWSRDAANFIKDESLDFVYIDGNHAFEYVVEDIALWSKKVRSGGIVYGHDYNDYSQTKRKFEMGVISAVKGWCEAYQIHPWFVLNNNQYKSWLYVKE